MKPVNKYGAVRTECPHGHTHASKREAKRCAELHLLLRAGAISALVIEPTYHFEVNGSALLMRNGHKAQYRPDFTYVENGRCVAEDIKSLPTATEAFRLRSALFCHCYPQVELRIIY